MSDENPKVNFDLPWPVERTTGGLVLTSKIYPIEAIDEYTALGSVYDLIVPPSWQEGVDTLSVIESIELRPILQDYEIDAEEIDSLGVVESIELRTILLDYQIDAEELDSLAVVESIELNTVLIEHENEAESIETQATITGIELT